MANTIQRALKLTLKKVIRIQKAGTLTSGGLMNLVVTTMLAIFTNHKNK